MAQGCGHPRFVVCEKRAHTIAEMPRDQRSIVRESLCGVPIGPTAVLVLQRRRQIPVIQRRKRLNVAFEQAVNEPVIELQATAVDGTVTGRLDSGPGNGKAISLDAERRDQVQVRFQAVVVIAGDLAVGAVRRRAWAEAELVPDGGALAVGARRAFDLESAARDPPQEILWKAS